jgi:hypothetical protein
MKVIDCRAVREVTAALRRSRPGGARLQQAAMQCLDVAASKGVMVDRWLFSCKIRPGKPQRTIHRVNALWLTSTKQHVGDYN